MSVEWRQLPGTEDIAGKPCKRCGTRCRLASGKGPHAASWRCPSCGAFNDWVSKMLLDDLTAGVLTDAMQRYADEEDG